MYSKIIDTYIKEHKTSFKASYCYHSCDRIDGQTFKFRYYVRDRQLLQMNIFLEIQLKEEVQVNVKEAVHEFEQWALAIDALERIRKYTNRKTTIAPRDIETFVNEKNIKTNTSPQDMINCLNYIMYHEGKNYDSIYTFYELFLPYLEIRLENKRYKEALTACNYLFEEILSEKVWQGFNIKYLDQEHFMHQAFIRSILNLIHKYFDEIEKEEFDLLMTFMLEIFHHWRLAFAMYSSLEKITVDYPEQVMRLLAAMYEQCHTLTLDGCCKVYDIMLALATMDDKAHRQSIIDVLELLMTDILSLANPEDQKQTGLIFLQMVGFDILMEIFDQTKDSYVYSCFDIADIPVDFHPYIQKQLQDALQYYAIMMKDSKKRMESIDQISNINTLLIEHFNVY